MRHLILSLLILASVVSFSQTFPPRPELLFTITGTNPAIASINYLDSLDKQDFVGIYDPSTMLCRGAFKVEGTRGRAYASAWGEYKQYGIVEEGFKYGDIMKLFVYKHSRNKFYELNGDVLLSYDGDNWNPSEFKFYPLNLYHIENVSMGKEITLSLHPELSKVFVSFENSIVDYDTKNGINYGLKVKSNNVKDIKYTLISGNGKITLNSYECAETDKVVVIEVNGINAFTNEIVTDRLTLNVTYTKVSCYEDDNVLIYLKGDKVFLKIKAEKASVNLFRFEKGIRKKMYGSGTKTQGFEQAFINGQYNRWKGIEVTIEYTYYINGKMANTVKTVNGKPVIEPVVKTFVL